MTLLDYLKTLTAAEQVHFATRCETSIGHLRNIAYGYKPASASLAMAIEEESGRKVVAETVTPNARWYVIRGRPLRQRAGA